MLNVERLAFELLTRIAPEGVTVIPALDVDTLESFPVVTFVITGGAALDTSGPKPTGWACQLDLSVFDLDMDSAIALAGVFYDGVHAWPDPWGTGAGIVDGLGHVSDVDDQALFTRAGTVAVTAERSVTQMVGAFPIQMHEA